MDLNEIVVTPTFEFRDIYFRGATYEVLVNIKS